MAGLFKLFPSISFAKVDPPRVQYNRIGGFSPRLATEVATRLQASRVFHKALVSMLLGKMKTLDFLTTMSMIAHDIAYMVEAERIEDGENGGDVA